MGTPLKIAVPRCVSCNRWGGERTLSADRRRIEHPEGARGRCCEGPWHGTLRGTMNACGRWIPWLELKSTAKG